MKLLSSTLIALAVTAGSSSADVNVRFIEGAPKDRFQVVAMSEICAEGPLELTLDLTNSAGKLIFDVTARGAGVEVFQSFELVAGEQRVINAPTVTDGDTLLAMSLDGLPGGSEVAFTIDVDDTIGAREITVARSEIVGAEVRLSSGQTVAEGVFDDSATAAIEWPACPA